MNVLPQIKEAKVKLVKFILELEALPGIDVLDVVQ